MSGRKISKLRFYYIAFMTGVYTLYYSMKVITVSFALTNRRRLVDKAMYGWANKLLGLVLVRVKVSNADKMPAKGSGPIIVMCNHSSLYDIPISALALNTSLRMLAKKELFRIPIFAAALKRGEFISIDRHNRDQSLKDLRNAKAKMLDGIILWVAPEGTRSEDGRVAKFKRGAFHVALDTGALIVPIAIKDIHKVQSGKNLTLSIDQEIEVEVCDPVDASKYNIESRRELIDAVRHKMLTALNQQEDSGHA